MPYFERLLGTHATFWVPWIERSFKAFVVLALAWMVTGIVGRFIRGLRAYSAQSMGRHSAGITPDLDKRTTTIITVLSKIASIIIWALAIVMALTEMTFKIEPLLAGLGVAGLAFGLGAQTLIKDWLGGLFIVLEDQLRLGDSVIINTVSGVVEELNLRTTSIRAENGTLHTIPNGSITILSNLSRDYAYWMFDTTLAHGVDAARALALLEAAGRELAEDPAFAPKILAPIEIMGVERLGEKGSVIRARIRAVPGKQYSVGRELNLRVKTAFDREGISFPPVV